MLGSSKTTRRGIADTNDNHGGHNQKLLVALYEYNHPCNDIAVINNHDNNNNNSNNSTNNNNNNNDNNDNNTTHDNNSVSSRQRMRKIKSWSNTSSDDEMEDNEDNEGYQLDRSRRSDTSRIGFDGQSLSRGRSVDGDESIVSIADSTHCSVKTFNTVDTYNTKASSVINNHDVKGTLATHPKPALR